jgi:hypothetical protein
MEKAITVETEDGRLEVCPYTVKLTSYKGSTIKEMVCVSIDDGDREMSVNLTKEQAMILSKALMELGKML